MSLKHCAACNDTEGSICVLRGKRRCSPDGLLISDSYQAMSALEAIRWQLGPPATLQLLDQRLLPLESVYIDIDGPMAAFAAIKVRKRLSSTSCIVARRGSAQVVSSHSYD